MSNAQNPPPDLSRNDIRRYVEALPIMGPTKLIPEQAATAACSVLREDNPEQAACIGELVTRITDSVLPELDQIDDGHYVITSTMLKGVVAKAVLWATGQFATDAGRALLETAELEAKLHLSDTPESDEQIG